MTCNNFGILTFFLVSMPGFLRYFRTSVEVNLEAVFSEGIVCICMSVYLNIK